MSPSDAARLRAWLNEQPWAEAFEKPWTLFAYRVRGETLAWSYYPKKKVLVEEGKAGIAGEAARTALADFIPQVAPEAAAVRRAAAYPYIGSDESGKGDTFGPLAVAACRLDRREEELVVTLGVRDSKQIPDAQIRPLAEAIRQAVPAGTAIRVLVPAIYNRAIGDVKLTGGNLNTLMGRLHAACIGELHAKAGGAAWAIIDKFGDEKYLRRELPAQLAFRCETRAEIYPAVAAGSILAREACLIWFEKELAAGRHWPRGSSDPRIVPLVKKVYALEGTAGLWECAKVHFSSVQKVIEG